MTIKFEKINNSIIKCKKCPRLISYSKKISKDKRKQNINEIYWGKPVPGFGDINGKLMILDLLLQHMEEQEQVGLLLEISRVIFYLIVSIKFKFQINLNLQTSMMV